MSGNTVDAVPAAAVSEELARIVNSPRFISSARLCRFLSHIVNRTIHGDLDSLKEFSIAMEVFDRTSEYDRTSTPLSGLRLAALERS
jgi:adenylate cyclase